ncbi:RHS repeat protein [Pseudomonas fluorescens]|uniref:RHS repeat protein n=1 Tax=Pseudomonas fluorescens TaxID=294 RepID=UPI001C463D05|nr:RHS repeat domain-containing protein [Pseudomonas fluorescens]QXN52771.1 RHS repeat protein [Pseudomonas fluorescens]WSO27114.1 RHS repeat domain-containing protein [Pseudomonas fluorescens]
MGGKHTRKFIIREDSLLHGQPLLTQDDNDVRIRYTYDGLHRVLSETVAPGDALYEGARNYRYTLTNADGQQASQIAIDVKGVQTRTLFDGLNRAIQEQRQDTDNRSGVQAEAFRDTYSARYNALGQLEEETELDWCSAQARDDLILTSRYTYDQWGEQCSVLRPDGVLEHEVTDPVKQVTTTWIEGMGKTVTLNNLFEKPDWVKRYTLGDDPNDPRVEPLSEHHYRYDGLGRSTEETDALSRTTRYGYDEFDRMIKSTLPDDVMVTRQYSPHSTGELPITIQVTPNEAGQQPIRVGTQTFDGLERLTQLNVGPRVETYEYSGSQFQVSKRTTPAGQAIDYFYVPELTEQPIRIETIEDKQSRFHYDPKTAYLGSSSNGQGQHDFDYDSAGNVTEHRWRVDGNTWTNHYRHSLGRSPADSQRCRRCRLPILL